MTRPQAEVEAVLELAAEGHNDCAIARATGVPRRTVSDWRRHGGRPTSPGGKPSTTSCPICYGDRLEPGAYAYLLGLYLGDGCVNECPRGGVQAAHYPRS